MLNYGYDASNMAYTVEHRGGDNSPNLEDEKASSCIFQEGKGCGLP